MSMNTEYRIRTQVKIKEPLQKLLHKYYPDTKPQVYEVGKDLMGTIYYFSTSWGYDEELEEEIVNLFQEKQGFIWIDSESSDFIKVRLFNRNKLINEESFDRDFIF